MFSTEEIEINRLTEVMRLPSKVLLYAGRNIYVDKDGKSVYLKAEECCFNELKIREKGGFIDFFKIEFNRYKYYELYKYYLSKEDAFDEYIYELMEIPFNIYMSFEENYILRKLFKQKPYKFEDWTFSESNTIKTFIESRSDLDKIITFPVFTKHEKNVSFPMVTKNDLMGLVSFVNKNSELLINCIKHYENIDTIVILGIKIEGGHDCLLELMYNRIFFGEYTRIDSSFFKESIEKQTGKNYEDLSSHEKGYIVEEIKQKTFFEFYSVDNKKIIFVPIHKTKEFIKMLYNACRETQITRELKLQNEEMFSKEINTLLKVDQIKEAIEQYAILSQTIDKKEMLISLAGRLSKIEGDNLKGVLEYDTYVRHRNMIRNDLLEIASFK